VASAVVVGFVQVHAQAQATPAAATAELKVGPASVPKHWSKYDYPEEIPAGVSYHIIEKGDTLWDLSRRYLGTPFLWPQLWEQNKYIQDAHWIYPGDPLILKKVEVIAEGAGQTPALPAPGPEAAPTPAPVAGEEAESPLFPATEETSLQCAPRLVTEKEDDSLQIIGSEQGRDKFTFAERDIIYLNKGGNAGIKAGDVFSVHGIGYKVKHPRTGRTLGTKVYTKGWARVILVQETSATAVVEQSCEEMYGQSDDLYAKTDYLRPFEKVTVPLLIRRPPPDRLTPPSGKAAGQIVDIAVAHAMGGTGDFVRIDLGSSAGIAPGNMLTVYRVVYPKVPTSRFVLGELAVLTVQENTALAKIMYSMQDVKLGDEVELR
jgi:LysM repeat protein